MYFQLQRDRSSIADAVACWISVRNAIPEKYTSLPYFNKQMKLGLTDIAITAHMMHPRYKGMIDFDI
jgi:hypothetical protein